MKIAITGHRPHKLGNDYDLTSPLILDIKGKIVNLIKELILSNVHIDLRLITGMALGIDTLFAKIAIENNIPFIAAVPFLGQQDKWPAKSRNYYLEIINNKLCTPKIICNPGYSAAKMQIRNEWMVDNCDLLIAVWDHTSGGTANCVKYAQSKNKEIIRINPNDFKS